MTDIKDKEKKFFKVLFGKKVYFDKPSNKTCYCGKKILEHPKCKDCSILLHNSKDSKDHPWTLKGVGGMCRGCV